jgi:hypothetical protein
MMKSFPFFLYASSIIRLCLEIFLELKKTHIMHAWTAEDTIMAD